MKRYRSSLTQSHLAFFFFFFFLIQTEVCGNMDRCKGIYCPTLINNFHESHFELAYQRYSHRQRQHSLILVNLVDLSIKLVLMGKLHNEFIFYKNIEKSNRTREIVDGVEKR